MKFRIGLLKSEFPRNYQYLIPVERAVRYNSDCYTSREPAFDAAPSVACDVVALPPAPSISHFTLKDWDTQKFQLPSAFRKTLPVT